MFYGKSAVEYLLAAFAQMSQPHSMALVYDLRDDHRYRLQILSQVESQWQAYLDGTYASSISEGRIVKLFYASYEGEHMFVLDDGVKQQSWSRDPNDDRFLVGRNARVETVVFCVPQIGDMLTVTRMWLDDEGS